MYTPIGGLLSGMWRGPHCSSENGPQFCSSHCPQSFYQTSGSCCISSTFEGMSYMYQYIDDICLAQASSKFHQICCMCDISFHCHFTLDFAVNLVKSALILTQVMHNSGAMTDTATGVLYPSPA